MSDFAPGPTGTDEVLFARDGVLGRVLLNRPRAINSLTREMVVAMRERLTEWADDDGIRAVSIEGAGSKGMCAGGDVRAVREAHLAGGPGGVDFWADEYALDAQIAPHTWHGSCKVDVGEKLTLQRFKEPHGSAGDARLGTV